LPDFRAALKDGRTLLFDGGYGTLLQSRGLPAGLSPELWGLKAPEVVAGVHRDYLEAGARVLTTNTFGGTRFKLAGAADARALNREMARLARGAAGDAAFVAGSVGPTGHFIQPLGELTFREMVAAFREQIQGLAEGGADLILGETHFDLAEARAVVIAAREACDLPVALTMTFEGPATLTGSDPLVCLDALQNMGLDLLGTNCSAGPEQMAATVRAMLPRLSVPLLVQPNAGLPELENGKTVFRLGPEQFAEQTARLADLGAKALGGCCGSTPAHIRALAARLKGRSWSLQAPADAPWLVLTSRSQSALLGNGQPCAIIGERINPTGKKALTAEIQAGRLDEALRLGEEQAAAGAVVLDVNVGAPLVREAELLPALVQALSAKLPLPLCLDSSDPEAVEEALWACPGSPLVNSISGEPGRLERLGPLCKKFGAPFILLPLEGKKLPVTAAERIAVIEKLLAQALALGIPKRLVLVDALALTVSSKPEAAKHCLAVIEHCTRVLGLPTTLGLSNISFGLPARELLNSTFLAMATAAGLSSCIANPSSARLRESLGAAEVLLNRDPQAGRYIQAFASWTPAAPAAQSAPAAPAAGTPDIPSGNSLEALRRAVVRGDREAVSGLCRKALEDGFCALTQVNEGLIPGIMDVGEKYERKEYFLPQLLRSAETMQTAFGLLKPLLEEAGGPAGPVVVMATVEGDIHDIGKNIVCLMLKNHGFEVLDLGKDVSAERIVTEAQAKGARLIGLSALMTTTMVRMEDTVRLLAERGLDIPVMIGGAVVTGPFAQAIGAAGHSTDAVSAVRLAKQLTGLVH